MNVPVQTVDTPAVLPVSYQREGSNRLWYVFRMTLTRRVIHWANALSIVVAAITGVYIAYPFYAARFPDLMAWNRSIHLYAAVVLDVSVIVIAYLYFFSRAERSVAQLVPTRRNLVLFQEAFLNFVMLNRRKRFDSSQPDPFNAVLFVVLHLLVVFQLLTGLQLYVWGLGSGISSVGGWWPWVMHVATDWTLPVLGGVGGVRLAHHATMYPIVAWSVLHVYYEIWRTVVWREGDIEISFGGYKFARAEHDDQR